MLLLAVMWAPGGLAERCAFGRRLLWRREVRRLRTRSRDLPSDFERTTFLREYVGTLIPIGRPDDRTRRLYATIDFVSFHPADFYLLFRNRSLSAQCGVTSFFYIKLLSALGFRAYQYSFGFTEHGYAQFVHSVALVEIARHEARRLIVQDPYFNLTYTTADGEPLDFFELLAALQKGQYDLIATHSPPLQAVLLIPDIISYDPYLSEECRQRMIEALTLEDGSMTKKMTIERSYASLMQSPCGGSEKQFLDALRVHGFDEPFVYAYTLRASDLVGELDAADLQRRIDAMLGRLPDAAGGRSRCR
jgi:hypothetical protein